mmetsp:Transcript_3023/g.6533  ORF Transcript_3023/g.6533 Transcript_3023/m.6533 type:complete len:790 (-) Transcript_3023:389-2758(-)
MPRFSLSPVRQQQPGLLPVQVPVPADDAAKYKYRESTVTEDTDYDSDDDSSGVDSSSSSSSASSSSSSSDGRSAAIAADKGRSSYRYAASQDDSGDDSDDDDDDDDAAAAWGEGGGGEPEAEPEPPHPLGFPKSYGRTRFGLDPEPYRTATATSSTCSSSTRPSRPSSANANAAAVVAAPGYEWFDPSDWDMYHPIPTGNNSDSSSNDSAAVAAAAVGGLGTKIRPCRSRSTEVGTGALLAHHRRRMLAGRCRDGGHDGAAAAAADASKSPKKEASGNMYEALWTNGPKERIEFFDYTYDDHFGKDVGLPCYMPRQPLLEYLVARVTRNNPTFFDDVRFNTAVTSVTYDEARSKFVITARDGETGAVDTAEYDKCIWAAGDNGKPSVPQQMDEMLKDGGYRGKTIHSSQVGDIDFESAARGKNVLMVGDSFSAEDLALVAIKAGAEKVYILSRSGEGIVSYISAWPQDKVEIIESMIATNVVQDGHGIRFEEMEYNTDDWDYKVAEGGETYDVEDISLVIYCTGYKSNLSMIDESLKKPYTEYEYFSDVPKDWKMKPNAMTEDIGDVPPYSYIDCFYGTVCMGIHHCLLMSNPNMMYISQFSSAPLFEIDVNAWLCLAYITGDAEIPSYEEMERRNAQQILDEMNVHNLRYLIDGNYYIAMQELEEGHWSSDCLDPRVSAFDIEEEAFHIRVIARNMCAAKYPDDIGTYGKFNEKGEKMVKVCTASWRHRIALPTEGPDSEWMTFRDGDPSELASIHTGTKAAPLKKRWMDLTEEDYSDLLGKGGVETS